MFCVNCGTQMPDGAKFCPKCGTASKPAVPAAPAQPQTQSIPGAAVNTAATAAASTVSAGVSTAGYVAGAAVAGAAKATVSTGKKFMIAGIILAVLLTIFTVYFTYFTEAPDEVVKDFFVCYTNADIEGMMECIEPSFGKQVNSMLGLGSSLLDIAGFGVDLSDIIGLAPMFSDYMDFPDYNPGNFKVVEYSGDKLSDFLESFGHKWIAVGNAIGEEAYVECDVDNISGGIITGIHSDAARVRVRFRVIKCGDDGWRLPEDLEIEYVGDKY